MQWKSLLPAFLAAGVVVAGLSLPASAEDQRGRGRERGELRGNREGGAFQRGEALRGSRERGDIMRSEIPPRADHRRFEQDAARRAMLEGDVMPFSIIKRRVGREMEGANYLGSEFDDRRGEYRLKYMRDGRVLWVDVDGRSGDIVRRSR